MINLLVVDLCGTLVRENTTHGFLQAMSDSLGAGFTRRLLLSRAGHTLGQFLPSLAHRRCLIETLAGCERRTMEATALAYAKVALVRSARTDVVRQVKTAQTEVVLASASIDIVVAAFASLLGLGVWIGTELEYDDRGLCTGRILRDTTGCKLACLEKLLGRRLEGFSLITDNPEDTDLMQVASHVQFLEASRD